MSYISRLPRSYKNLSTNQRVMLFVIFLLTFNDSSPGFLVETLDVPLLADLDRSSHVYLDKPESSVLVKLASYLSLLVNKINF